MNPYFMTAVPFRPAITFLCLAWLVVATAPRISAADSEFSKPLIDIGIVVSDLAKSAAFYTNAIGFKEVSGFKVSGERAGETGLTDNQPADIRVFVLGEGDLATRVKMMSFTEAPGNKPDQKFIHSTLGISYLTFHVADMTHALARLKKEGGKLLGKTPLDLGGGNFIAVSQDPDGNFIELVGPRKE